MYKFFKRNIIWIIFSFILFFINSCFIIFILKDDLSSFLFLISFGANILFLISFILFGIVRSLKTQKDKLVLLRGLFLISIVHLYKAFQIVDIEFWNFFDYFFRVFNIILVPVSYLVLLIGFWRFIKK